MPIINTYIGSKKPEAITITPDAQTAAVTPTSVLASGTYINISKGYNNATVTYQAPSGTTIVGNATPGQVLAGSTFMSTASPGVQTGTMVNRGSWGYTVTNPEGLAYPIPEGYHNGEGIITANITSSSPVLNVSGYTPVTTLTEGTQIYIPEGYYNTSRAYDVPSGGSGSAAYILPYDDAEGTIYGKYERDSSLDHDVQLPGSSTVTLYGWTNISNPAPPYTEVYTTVEIPSEGASLYDTNGYGASSSMGSYLVKEYHPEESSGWTAWTTLGQLGKYAYIHWRGTNPSYHICDAFYISSSLTDDSHCGSLYYGGLNATVGQMTPSIENVRWEDSQSAPITGDYALNSYIQPSANNYRGYWHSIGTNGSAGDTNDLTTYTESNPLTFTVIGHMDPTDYIEIYASYSPETTDANVEQWSSRNSFTLCDQCNAVTVQMYADGSGIASYRYKKFNA